MPPPHNVSIKVAVVKLITNHSFKILFLFRICSFLQKKKNNIVYKILYFFSRVIYKRIMYKTGIQLPIGTRVGHGLFFPHFSGIVIRPDCVIGNGVTILQGCTIGQSRGPKDGIAIIGDNCVLSAGVKIIGKVRIGANSIIGANAVVTKDLPDNSVAVGIPAKVISEDGLTHVKYWNRQLIK